MARKTHLAIVPAPTRGVGNTPPDADELLAGALDHQVLRRAGWDSQRNVFIVPSAHPVLGWQTCVERTCARPAERHQGGFCSSHYNEWRKAGKPETFASALRPPYVPKRPLDVQCAVDICDNAAEVGCLAGQLRTCKTHKERYQKEVLANEWWAADPEVWSRETAPIRGQQTGIVIDLRRLRSGQRLECLYVLQAALKAQRADIADGMVTLPRLMREFDGRILDGSLVNAISGGHASDGVYFVRYAIETIDLFYRLNDDNWYAQPRWPLGRWIKGLKGAWVNFEGTQGRPGAEEGGLGVPQPPITQPWLLAAVKRYASHRLSNTSDPRSHVRAAAFLSASLYTRSDHGDDPAVLDRADVDRFKRHLEALQGNGRLPTNAVRDYLWDVRTLLTEAAQMFDGGQRCLTGLNPHFTIVSQDLPKRIVEDDYDPEDDVGRSLPTKVVKQLLKPEALAQIEATIKGQHVGQQNRVIPSASIFRNVLQLQSRVGRRTAELLTLPYECIQYREVVNRKTGEVQTRPRLVVDMPKVNKKGFLLPIDDATVRVIEDQRTLVREAHPDTPTNKLALFPQPNQNMDGTKPLPANTSMTWLKNYAKALKLTHGRSPDGKPAPFDVSNVFWYAFRHSYAQRYADRGVPQPVLQDLMGHKHGSTTAGYYKVTQLRMQQAVDKASPMAIDRHGNPVEYDGLDDAERTRSAAYVAVPLGHCTDDQNVKADGGACPIMYRCTGCAKYQTDPTFLPDLENYLTQLLVADRNLTNDDFDAAPWVRNERPTEEHIDGVKRLIFDLRKKLDELDPEKREDFDEAAALVRSQRERLMLTLPAEARMSVGVRKPVYFPARLPIGPPPAGASVTSVTAENADPMDSFEEDTA